MEALETRTQHKNSNRFDYKGNLKDVITFLRHPEDKIKIINAEQVQIEVYYNGDLIFSGDKLEFFNKLKS